MAIITGGASGMGDEFAAHGARAIVIAEPSSSLSDLADLSLSLSFGGWLFWLLLVGWDLWIGVDVGYDVGFGSALMWVLGRHCGCEIWDGWRLMKVVTDDLDRWRLLLVFVWWNDESVAMFVCLNQWLFVCLNRWWFGIWVVVVLGDCYLLGFFFYFFLLLLLLVVVVVSALLGCVWWWGGGGGGCYLAGHVWWWSGGCAGGGWSVLLQQWLLVVVVVAAMMCRCCWCCWW